MSSHAAALHGICPVALYVQLSAAGIVSDVCPMACLCTGIGAVASDPRGGGQRDRERFANLSLSLRHLSTLSGRSLRRG